MAQFYLYHQLQSSCRSTWHRCGICVDVFHHFCRKTMYVIIHHYLQCLSLHVSLPKETWTIMAAGRTALPHIRSEHGRHVDRCVVVACMPPSLVGLWAGSPRTTLIRWRKIHSAGTGLVRDRRHSSPGTLEASSSSGVRFRSLPNISRASLVSHPIQSSSKDARSVPTQLYMRWSG